MLPLSSALIPLAPSLCRLVCPRPLQRADVSDDGPTILRRYLRVITRHRAPSVRDDVEEMSDGSFTQLLRVIRRRATKTAPHDEAVAVAGHPMTHRAENPVALLPAIQEISRHRTRKDRRRVRAIHVGRRTGTLRV